MKYLTGEDVQIGDVVKMVKNDRWCWDYMDGDERNAYRKGKICRIREINLDGVFIKDGTGDIYNWHEIECFKFVRHKKHEWIGLVKKEKLWTPTK